MDPPTLSTMLMEDTQVNNSYNNYNSKDVLSTYHVPDTGETSYLTYNS